MPLKPEDFFPNPGPQPSPEFLGLCIEKMADYMKLAENTRVTVDRERALGLAEGYAKVYRALKS